MRALPRVAVASAIGTALEWYDFALYGLAAALVFGPVFFPAQGGSLATLASFATFAVGFLFRPLGGVVIGHYGDRLGRRTMLFVTLMMMGVASVVIGLLPSYAQIGPAAPMLLVLMRVLQGLGSGAEYAGASLMSTESAPDGRRGFWGSFPVAGNGVGMLLGTGAFSLVSLLPHDDFMSWGWRLPFLVSVIVAAVALYIRLKLPETRAFSELKRSDQVLRSPLTTGFRTSRRTLLLALVGNFAPNIAGYLPSVFVVSYAVHIGASKNSVLDAVLAANLVRLVTPAIFGAISDRVGRRPVYVGASVAATLWAFPFFWLVETRSPGALVLAVVVLLGIVDGALLGPQPAFYSELFPSDIRYSSMAFSRELSAALVGGTAPFVATALVAAGGSTLVSAYVAGIFLVSAIAARLLPETLNTALDSTTTERPAPAAQPEETSR